MTRLLILRHALSVWNAEGRWQGWADPPLSPVGEHQAAEAAHLLRSMMIAADHGSGQPEGPLFTALVSSDLRRARQTVEILGSVLGVPGPVQLEPGLREYDVGEWSGLSRDDIEARWPGMVARWGRGELTATPGGEERAHFEQRVLDAVVGVAHSHPGGQLLVVSHGGVVRALARKLGHPMTHVGHLSGCWIERFERGLEVTESVDLLAGAAPASTPEQYSPTL